MSRSVAKLFSSRLRALAALIAFCSFAELAMGQVNPGTPSFSAYDSGQYDTINLQNLNVGLHIPVMSKSGAFPFKLAMSGGNSYVFDSGGTLAPGIIYTSLRIAANNLVGGLVPVGYGTPTSATCPVADGGGSATELGSWHIITNDGTFHPFPATDVIYVGTTCSSSFTDTTIDGSGFTLTVTSSGGTVSVGTISTSGGATYNGDSFTDSNSNTLSYSAVTGNYTDTLGLTAATVTTSATNVIGSIGWTDISGSPAVTPTYTSYTLESSFNCSGAIDYSDSGIYLPTAFAFPDTTSLQLSWENNEVTSSYKTGRLAKITLRSGSTVSFNYNPGGVTSAPYNLNCTYLIPNSMTRTTSDGMVTYTWTKTTAGNTTTRLDIGKNKTVFTFNSTPVLTEVQSYVNTGTVASPTYSSTPTKQIVYCYNTSSPTVSSCPTAVVQEPITEVDAFTTLGGMSTSSRQQTQYDGGPSGALPHYGNVTYSAQYLFGATSPTRTTTITYGSACGSGSTVNNKPCSVITTENDSGTAYTVAYSKYSYDTHGNLLTTYVSPNGGTSFLSNPTVNSYNGNGTPSTTYDLAGNATTYAYNSANYTGCGSCTQYPFATSVTKGGLTTYATWNGIGGVKLTDEDASSNVTIYGYESSGGTADPWWRLRSVTDPLSDETWITPTVTSLNSSFEFNSSNSIQSITTTVDGYGRPIDTQKQQSPTGTNYDTVSTTYSFGGVNPTVFTTIPCPQTLGNACTGGYGATNTFDMLGRLVSSVQSGSNANDTISYSENDVLNALGPAPTFDGEHLKQTQTEYDGLGRPAKICHIGNGSSTACGQNTGSQDGVTDVFMYSAAAGSQRVSIQRGGGQTRSTYTDGLGRAYKKVTPEGGTWGLHLRYEHLLS
jgi:hypothetical protein